MAETRPRSPYAMDAHRGLPPFIQQHLENEAPSATDAADSQLSMAGLNLEDAVRSRHNSFRQDTIAYQAIHGLETASDVVTLVAAAQFSQERKRCADLVQRIASECREANKLFRDANWDISTDRKLCLQGLLETEVPEDVFKPWSSARVHEIFEDPKVFMEGAKADAIRQGAIADCWFASALSVVSNKPGLLESLCVCGGEEAGIYGFLFFRDGRWTTTIIDDQLFVMNRQFDQLKAQEKRRWHGDRTLYADVNLRKSRALYFASSVKENETWVPLYEKAYAKAHGDYESIVGGFTGEAVEDLTGGVSTLFNVKDIYDENRFWEDELLHANKDRLLACYVELDHPGDLTGLIHGHAYSILEAKEVKGKRFVVIRNPWGEGGEWQGPWGDGAEEWNPEWMQALEHRFGNDGRFVMAYSDFLKVWQTVDRCLLFDNTWRVRSTHVETKLRAWPAAPSFGDVCFIVTLTKASPAIFVLSQHDNRYWKGLEGYLHWSLEFRVFRAGEQDCLRRSEKGRYDQRSVNVEFKDLQPGRYVVHVRLDRHAFRKKDYRSKHEEPPVSKLCRVQAKLMESCVLAPNYNRSEAPATYLSPPSRMYDGRTLKEIPRDDAAEEGKEPQQEQSAVKIVLDEPPRSRRKVAFRTSPQSATFPLEESLPTPKTAGAEEEEDNTSAAATTNDETTRSDGEETTRANQRKTTDSVFLLFRVYSKDESTDITYETRL